MFVMRARSDSDLFSSLIVVNLPFTKDAKVACREIVSAIIQDLGGGTGRINYIVMRVVLHRLIYNPIQETYGKEAARYLFEKLNYTVEDTKYINDICGLDSDKIRRWEELIRPRLSAVCSVLRKGAPKASLTRGLEAIEKEACQKQVVKNAQLTWGFHPGRNNRFLGYTQINLETLT